MKILIYLALTILPLINVANAATSHKRVAIKKVIKAIEEDPEKALKDYALFTSRFEVVPDADKFGGNSKGVIKKTTQRYISSFARTLYPDKKYKFSCKLEKYKTDAGIEKIRIRITEILK